MITYTQQKKGLSYVYDKRQVLSDGCSTLPLPIEIITLWGEFILILN